MMTKGLNSIPADVVNATNDLDITQARDQSKASSSGMQRLGLNRKVLQQTCGGAGEVAESAPSRWKKILHIQADAV